MGLKHGWNEMVFTPKELETSSCWQDYAIEIRLNGSLYGDIVDDNAWTPSYYRYHDLFHIGFFTLWGSSPVMQRLANKSSTGQLKCRNEESFVVFLFEIFYDRTTTITNCEWKVIQQMTKRWCRITQDDFLRYTKVIFPIYDLLIANHGGVVKFNQLSKELRFEKMDTVLPKSPVNTSTITEAWPLKM